MGSEYYTYEEVLEISRKLKMHQRILHYLPARQGLPTRNRRRPKQRFIKFIQRILKIS